LQKWTAGDRETPMDVDPEQTEAEVVLELERVQGAEDANFLESIPVVVFANKAKKYSSATDGSSEKPKAVVSEEEPENQEKRGLPAIMIVLLFMIPTFIVLCLIAGIVLYFFGK
jgi:hypothetical protein